jgi:hypothetical protein
MGITDEKIEQNNVPIRGMALKSEPMLARRERLEREFGIWDKRWQLALGR